MPILKITSLTRSLQSTDKHMTHRHRNLDTKLAPRADSVKNLPLPTPPLPSLEIVFDVVIFDVVVFVVAVFAVAVFVVVVFVVGVFAISVFIILMIIIIIIILGFQSIGPLGRCFL